MTTDDDDALDDRLRAHLVETLDGVEGICQRNLDRVTQIVTTVLDGRRADRELITELLAHTTKLIGLTERVLACIARSATEPDHRPALGPSGGPRPLSSEGLSTRGPGSFVG